MATSPEKAPPRSWPAHDRGWRARVWHELRLGLGYVPLCVAPLVLAAVFGDVDLTDPGSRYLVLLLALSCWLMLLMTWVLYRSNLDAAAQRRALDELVRRDSLTGLSNRRALWEMADKEVRRSVRQGYPLSLLLIDLDDFKEVNDAFGHSTGDEVLRTFAGVIQRCCRVDQDQLFRIGGDEFVVVLPGSVQGGAVVVGERVRRAFLAELARLLPGEHTDCSIGVAQLELDETAEGLLHRADVAMYEAKASKGGVVLATEVGPTMERSGLRQSLLMPGSAG